MFTSIVIALDLEQEGDRALPIARSLSPLTDVAVELLTVQSPNLPEWGDAIELRRRAEASGWPDASCTVLQSNEPADAIADHVNLRPGALLVMATTAKSPPKQQFLGSVSEGVLDRVRGPVLLVGPHVPSDADMSRPTLVVCVDSIDGVTSARPAVAAWMHTFKSMSPWVVEVLPAPLERFGIGRDIVESAYVKCFAEELANADIDASWDVLHGVDVGERLEEFSRTIDHPVLVTTSTNWTDHHTHWHSTTRRLVQRATRPVLVVPRRGARPAR